MYTYLSWFLVLLCAWCPLWMVSMHLVLASFVWLLPTDYSPLAFLASPLYSSRSLHCCQGCCIAMLSVLLNYCFLLCSKTSRKTSCLNFTLLKLAYLPVLRFICKLELGCLMSNGMTAPKILCAIKKMLPFMKVLGKKIQLLLWIWFKDVLCISVNAITPV